jgi:hypothetical protein
MYRQLPTCSRSNVPGGACAAGDIASKSPSSMPTDTEVSCLKRLGSLQLIRSSQRPYLYRRSKFERRGHLIKRQPLLALKMDKSKAWSSSARVTGKVMASDSVGTTSDDLAADIVAVALHGNVLHALHHQTHGDVHRWLLDAASTSIPVPSLWLVRRSP